MDVKEKKREKEKKRNKNSESECVCLYVFYFFIYILFFNDKIADIKEEFNILIGSRFRFINLYISDISNFR